MIDPIKVQRDLNEILRLADEIHGQALASANATVDGSSLPGGLALVTLAPVADPWKWARRVDLTEEAWLADPHGTRPDLTADEDDTWEPALQTIRWWSDRYRRFHDQDWDHIPTLVTETNFLLHHLNWILSNEPLRDTFASDVNLARRRLENVVVAGTRPQRTAVKCTNPKCENPRELIRTHGRRFIVGWTCSRCDTAIPASQQCTTCHHTTAPTAAETCRRMVGKKDEQQPCGGGLELTSPGAVDHCPNPWCFTVAPPAPIWASRDSDDRWKCTSCKTRYDADDYLDAYSTHLRHQSTDRYVRQADAIDTLAAQGTSKATVMRWLRPPLEHDHDHCDACGGDWPAGEYERCPQRMKDGTTCGRGLRAVWKGNRENVVDGYCDLATHRTFVKWSDLWSRHLQKRSRDLQRARRQDTHHDNTRTRTQRARKAVRSVTPETSAAAYPDPASPRGSR